MIRNKKGEKMSYLFLLVLFLAVISLNDIAGNPKHQIHAQHNGLINYHPPQTIDPQTPSSPIQVPILTPPPPHIHPPSLILIPLPPPRIPQLQPPRQQPIPIPPLHIPRPPQVKPIPIPLPPHIHHRSPIRPPL
ncbi:36.4 kDa proline-rich protein isoform X3 [Lathyrus oleraceus]|uniref:36.4 kDa proline-rich protein isoform X3 n=1 Tax=Pisum sativum TaxID=3888 RepID=UPI0021D08A04|nr:36.4 kDa proline-rich protein-like isoform X3 [Pisum sativum]